MSEPKQYIHRELASGRSHTMTLADQVGNIGSEYERALRGKEKGDAKYFEGAMARLFELLDLTMADPRWSNHRVKKLSRMKEVICDELCNEVREHAHSRHLREYFLLVGILANKQRAAARKQQSAIGNE